MENPFSMILASTARGRSESSSSLASSAVQRIGENGGVNIPSSKSSESLASLVETPSKGTGNINNSSNSSSSSRIAKGASSPAQSLQQQPQSTHQQTVAMASAKKLSRPSSFRMIDSPAPKTPQKLSAAGASAAAAGRCRSSSKDNTAGLAGSFSRPHSNSVIAPPQPPLFQTAPSLGSSSVVASRERVLPHAPAPGHIACKTLDRALAAKQAAAHNNNNNNNNNNNQVDQSLSTAAAVQSVSTFSQVAQAASSSKTVLMARQRNAVRKIRTRKDSLGAFSAPEAASEEEVAVARRRQSMAIVAEIKTLVQRAEAELGLAAVGGDLDKGVAQEDLAASSGCTSDSNSALESNVTAVISSPLKAMPEAADSNGISFFSEGAEGSHSHEAVEHAAVNRNRGSIVHPMSPPVAGSFPAPPLSTMATPDDKSANTAHRAASEAPSSATKYQHNNTGASFPASKSAANATSSAAFDSQDRKRESLALDSALISKMLPRKVCLHVRQGKPVPPEFFSNVSIFFSDVVGFTNISAAVEPINVIQLLNTLFTVMDYVTSLFPLYKVETIGDAYMVASGLPEPSPDNSQALADFAILVSHAVGVVTSPLDGSSIRIRMGMHSGDVMAGVVGSMMPRYCLFGDTVNTASRMESNGEPGRIHISEAIASQLLAGGRHIVEERGEIEVKGKGVMRTYWLVRAAPGKNDVSSDEAIQQVVGYARELVAAAHDFGSFVDDGSEI